MPTLKEPKILQKENLISHSTMEEPNRQPDQGIEEEIHFNDFMFLEYKNARRMEIEEAL